MPDFPILCLTCAVCRVCSSDCVLCVFWGVCVIMCVYVYVCERLCVWLCSVCDYACVCECVCVCVCETVCVKMCVSLYLFCVMIEDNCVVCVCVNPVCNQDPVSSIQYVLRIPSSSCVIVTHRSVDEEILKGRKNPPKLLEKILQIIRLKSSLKKKFICSKYSKMIHPLYALKLSERWATFIWWHSISVLLKFD